MEWVETTGTTLEEAKDAALDELGVAEDEAEFEVVDEPKTGLFGRVRVEARVRARVRPTRPRPKQERSDRRRRGSEKGASGEGKGEKGSGGRAKGTAPAAKTRGTEPRPRRDQATAPAARTTEGQESTMDDATVEQQAEIIGGFVTGLVDAFGTEGDLLTTKVDDDTIEIQVDGDDLGLLIGPKGQTLSAVQELSRTVVQRRATGTHHGRVRLDIGRYRERRREALERFSRQLAEQVLDRGQPTALEPMGAADRKAVHDAINELDGVTTTSEGEEPRRRVVILPE